MSPDQLIAPDELPVPGPSRLPSLSVVIPAYNAATTLPRTVESVLSEVSAARWPDVEIVLVDDGSTDSTATCLDAFTDRCHLVVLRQENSGRFLARRHGLEQASGELALLIDSRVRITPGSLTFLRDQVFADRSIWNAHVVTAPSRALASHFWDAITAIAWRRYYRDPRHVEIELDTYDYYPKGTTMFAAPRQLLLDACASFDTEVDELRFANDDTLLLRPLLETDVINLAPDFGCVYESRSTIRAFVRHSFHRGTVLIDGHDRPGSRFRLPIRVSLVAMPALAAAALVRPRTLLPLGLAACASLAAVARWAGAERRAAASLGVLSPLFAVTYWAGMVRGVAVRSIARRRRGAPTAGPLIRLRS